MLLLSKLIHWMIMPCVKATQEIEKQKGGHKMSLLQRQRLKVHLSVCKWCSSYQKKVVFIDSRLRILVGKEKSCDLVNTNLEEFKNNLKEKIIK